MRKQFNRKKLEKLNNPERLGMIPPEYIWKTLAPDHHTDKVEIGAGTGLFSKAFQELSGEGHTIALDISEEMVTWMKENIIEEFPQIIPMKTNGKNLPLADNSADIVFMICLHHEIESPEALLSEVRRILRNSGKMFIVDWNKNKIEHGPPAEIRTTAEAVSAQLTNSGFRNVRIDSGFDNFFFVTAEG